MNVEELIEQLHKCPKSAQVCLEIGGRVYGVCGAVELLGTDVVDIAVFEYAECGDEDLA